MESDFYELYGSQSMLALCVSHNSVGGWCIDIFDKKFSGAECKGILISSVESSDRRYAFAKAYADLADYLSTNRGGY